MSIDFHVKFVSRGKHNNKNITKTLFSKNGKIRQKDIVNYKK